MPTPIETLEDLMRRDGLTEVTLRVSRYAEDGAPAAFMVILHDRTTAKSKTPAAEQMAIRSNLASAVSGALSDRARQAARHEGGIFS